MDWRPTLDDRPGPVYARIADALASDVAGGRLHRGQQLPTHRSLAKALGIDLTTVTRAYREAQRRGLTEARVGQGTFVAEGVPRPRSAPALGPEIDLSMNLPPQPPEADLEGRIARGLAAIQRDVGFSGYLNYRRSGGTEDERNAVADWLRYRLPDVSGDRVAICPGTQTALVCLLSLTTAAGDTVLTEELTYPGFKAAARQAGVRVVGVPLDREGVMPDALKAACRRHRPKALYLTPTMHNPTTATMSLARRERIAGIVRDHELTLIEDDAYGLLDPGLTPLAALVPDRAFLATSLSKCIAPGLRVAFVTAPDRDAAARFTGALRATVQMPVPLIVALVTRWLRDGSADTIIKAIRDEAAARQKLAGRALAGHAYDAHPRGHHIWLPLPEGWSRAEFATHVQRQGLAVVTSETFSVAQTAPNAIRVALGAAPSRAELARALDVLATALKSTALTAQIV